MSEKAFRTYKGLMPFAFLYASATAVRNRLYGSGMLKSCTAPVPVICVGNITAGGTGKTPHTEYLLELLHGRYATAVLSRGYGRSTKGYLKVSETSTARTVGDEPLQMFTRFPDVTFAVCEKRAEGIRRLVEEENPDVIILDDAFQHRAVHPSLNILLINWNRNILDDAVLPAGLLREPASGRKRADIMIVTKCPDGISREDMHQFVRRLKPSEHQEVFFTGMKYGSLLPLDGNGPRLEMESLSSTPVIFVTGIAFPQPATDMLRRFSADVTPLLFPDHHAYSAKDVAKMQRMLDATGNGIIVTTSKDAAKITGLEIVPAVRERIYVLPVTMEFIEGSDRFGTIITDHIQDFKKNRK